MIVLALATLAILVSTGFAGSPDSLGDEALSLVNGDREEHGLDPLRSDPGLEAAAREHAADMLQRGYFSHQSPEGENAMHRFRAQGGSEDLAVAENIGRCDGCTPPATPRQLREMHEGWMESPGHRENILAPGLDRFGFGFAIDGSKGLYAVQTFAGPGMSRDGDARSAAHRVTDDEGARLALDEINDARGAQGLEALDLSERLSGEASDLLEDARRSGTLNLRELRTDGALGRLTDSGRRGWRSVSMVAGECGGCGIAITAADVEHFVGQWLENPGYRDHLLDPRARSLGFAAAGNGSGKKLALAFVATR